VERARASCYHRGVQRYIIAIVIAGCSKPAPHRDDLRVADPGRRDEVPESARPDDNRAHAPVDAQIAIADAPVAARVAIVEEPMKWSDERERLTLDYRRAHSDANAQDLTIDPKVIVLHYTGGNSAKSTRAYFDNVKLEAARKQLARGGAVNVSAHFVVDRDGTIYRLQPETRFARHCIGLNHIAIGIENVGDGQKYPLTDAQVAADAALVRELAGRFKITHLLGHHEVMRFRDHAYYVELDPTYKNDKGDPGAAFMARVRERVGDLGLAGL
jgi:N-acetylmuramoyl-L-alanine amidase